MADQKISELTALTGANVADDDAIAIVDTSATETKKIVFSELKNALDTATGFVRITGDTMTGALDVQSTITSDGLTVDGTGVVGTFSSSNNNTVLRVKGNGATNGGAIGSTSTDDLVLLSGLTEKMRIDSSGNVGIGTSSPNGTLTVRNDSTNTEQLILGNSINTGGRDWRLGRDNAASGDFIIKYSDATNSNVTAEAMRIDSSGNVGIGTSSPAISSKLNVESTTQAIDSGGTIFASVTDAMAADIGGQVMMGGYHTGTTTAAFGGFAAKKENATNGNYAGYLQFMTSSHGAGNTEKMRIDSSGRVGIGTSSPSSSLGAGGLHVTDRIAVGSGSAGTPALHYDGDTDTGLFFGTGVVAVSTGGTERMRIDSSGNVGIGTASPNFTLQLDSKRADATFDANDLDTWADFKIQGQTASGNARGIYFDFDSDTGNDKGAGIVGISGDVTGGVGSLGFITTAGNASAERMRITSAGNVGIGTSDPVENLTVGATTTAAGFSLGSATTQAYLRYNNYFSGTSQVSDATKGSASISLGRSSDGVITFNTAAAGAGTPTEAARFDNSGNLLVGTTDTTPYNNNAGTSADQGLVVNDGRIYAATNSNSVMILNRTASDGEIVQFRKDGTTVGSIGSVSDGIYIGNGEEGIRFDQSLNSIIPCTGTGGGLDNHVTLGADNPRFKDLYLSGGVYLGGTGADNKLDDYEEGTWTPNLGGTATYNHQIANYTKVGRVVTVHFDIDVSAIGSGSTSQLSGLPFTSQNIGAPQVGAVAYFEDIATACVFLGVYTDNNSQTMQFTGGNSSATLISRNAFTVFGNNTRIIGTLTYMTN